MGLISTAYPVNITVNPWSRESLGGMARFMDATSMSLDNATTGTWGVGNAAVLIPFTLDEPTTFVKMSLVGNTASGNVDLGIYDEKGTRLVSTGSTAAAFTNGVQQFDITDTRMGPGRFYLAFSTDDITTLTIYLCSVDPNLAALMGVKFPTASGFPLPATLTGASRHNAFAFGSIPVICATTRSVL